MKLGIPQKFWKKYIEADYLERDKILEPVIKFFDEMVDALHITKNKKLKGMSYKHFRKHMITLGLRSYLDDLIETFYILENERKKH